VSAPIPPPHQGWPPPGGPLSVGGLPTPPVTIQLAVALTWLGSVGTAGLTFLTTIVWLWLGHAVFDKFDGGTGNPRFWLVVGALVTIALSVVAVGVAWQVWRGREWACWALLGLCAVTVVAGAITAAGALPMIPAALAFAVAVCLLLPQSRAWFRERRTSLAT
jgi:hypothetical protein